MFDNKRLVDTVEVHDETMTAKSSYTCPVCGKFLSLQGTAAGYIILYCGNGPCPSKAANNGAIGGTELRAFETLARLIDQESDAFAA